MRYEITEEHVFEIVWWGCVVALVAGAFVWVWLAA
jgi:hypothetical protein